MPDLTDNAHPGARTPSCVKVFGERNTGTNAFAKLIRKNSSSKVLPTQINELPGLSPLIGRALSRIAFHSMRESLTDWVFSQAAVADKWKHRATYFDDSELVQLAQYPTFIMIRHPASWLFGLRRRPYHALQAVPEDLGVFLQTDWRTAGREGLDRKRYRPAELYNEKLRSYLWFEKEMHNRGGTVEFIRFEDFVIDQLSVFNRVSSLLTNASTDPQIIASSTKKSGKSAEDYAQYYRSQVWADAIDPKACDIIAAEIDWRLAARFYGPEDWRAHARRQKTD